MNKKKRSIIKNILILSIIIIIIYLCYDAFLKKPYVNLDFLTSKSKIQELNEYLLNEKKIYSWKTKDFIAKKQTHAKKIPLSRCNKCKRLEHYEKRLVKGNSSYHIPNENYYDFPKLITFVKELDIFEDMGEIAIIINEANEKGIEHRDHDYKWVSEFIWIRTNNIKQFYIKNKYGISHTVNNNIIWFDDQRTHNIHPVDKKSFSIRINGKFNNKFRKWIANQNNFFKSNNKQILLNNENPSLI